MEKIKPSERFGKHTFWLEYAVRDDEAVLWASVVYNHSVRGTWRWVLIDKDGEQELDRKPRLGKRWILTDYAEDVEFERSNG